MSNIPIVNNNEYLLKNNKVFFDNEKPAQNKLEKKEKEIKDVLDDSLKNSIKQENIIASEQDITSVEQASSILSDVLNKIGNLPSASKLHINIDNYRVNALINQ